MQISVEAGEGLEKRMTVEVPADKIESEVKKRLQSMRPNIKLQGFRPGKVPLPVVTKRYGPHVREEVTGELISNSFYEAVTEKDLKPAGMPKIENRTETPDKGVSYTAVFEVYPEFEITGVESIEIEKPVVEIQESDIDNMIEKLRKQRASWETVDRPAQMDDQLTIDFKGTIDGEPFAGGEGEDMKLVLGAGRMIDGFEEGLVGKCAGETVELDLKFPDDYHSADVAGKDVHFSVTIKSVEAPKLPEVDEAFIKEFGVEDGSMESFREELKQNMQRELDRVIAGKIKDQVMEGLLKANQFDIPKSMIEAEGARIANQMNDQLQMSGNKLPQGMKPFEASQFLEEGKRRVALGLILAEIIKANDIKAEPEKVRAEIEKMAAAYDDPQAVVSWYYQDKSRLSEIESIVLEEQVVNWVLERAQVTDKLTSFEDIMKDSR